MEVHLRQAIGQQNRPGLVRTLNRAHAFCRQPLKFFALGGVLLLLCAGSWAKRVLIIDDIADGPLRQVTQSFIDRAKSDPLPGVSVEFTVVKLDLNLEMEAPEQLVREVLRHRPADAVLGGGESFARAFRDLAPDLALIFDAYHDPRRVCAVDQLERPGGNVTGTYVMPESGGKMAELLLQAYPGLRHLVVLVDDQPLGQQRCNEPLLSLPAPDTCQAGWVRQPESLDRLLAMEQFTSLQANKAVDLRVWKVCRMSDLTALALSLPPRDVGLIVPNRDTFYHQAGELVRRVKILSLPAIYQGISYTNKGGLMAMDLHVDASNLMSSQWNLLRQVLAGRSPSGLPVEAPRHPTLVFNRSAARELGLAPSRSFLRRVDEFVDKPSAARP